MTTSLRSSLARCRRPVIKLGSTVLAGAARKAGPPSLDRRKFALLCDDLAAAAKGRTPVVVSSGAVERGVERLPVKQRPPEMGLKEAAGPARPNPPMAPVVDEPAGRAPHRAPDLPAACAD